MMIVNNLRQLCDINIIVIIISLLRILDKYRTISRVIQNSDADDTVVFNLK